MTGLPKDSAQLFNVMCRTGQVRPVCFCRSLFLKQTGKANRCYMACSAVIKALRAQWLPNTTYYIETNAFAAKVNSCASETLKVAAMIQIPDIPNELLEFVHVNFPHQLDQSSMAHAGNMGSPAGGAAPRRLLWRASSAASRTAAGR